MNEDDHRAFALVLVESIRPVVDRTILELVNAETFTGADFSIQHNGVCRLNPELARRVAQLAVEHYESQAGSMYDPLA